MSKNTVIDTKILKNKKNICEITGAELEDAPELKDVDRIVPKRDGGTYDQDNIRIVDPTARMILQETYRKREGKYDELKGLIDDRSQIIKLLVKIGNQILAYKRRTDHPSHLSIEILEEASQAPIRRKKELDKEITSLIHSMKKEDALINATLNIKGVGEITVAHMTAYFNLEEAEYPSSLCSYCGYDKANHERYIKGQSSGGNKTLRAIFYNMATSMIKHKAPYAEKIYYPEKLKLENSHKITKSRNTQGKLVECMWKDTKAGHRHGAALRKMIKIFLHHYWLVGRLILNLPTREPYVQEKLGHKNIITPKDMGWDW